MGLRTQPLGLGSRLLAQPQLPLRLSRFHHLILSGVRRRPEPDRQNHHHIGTRHFSVAPAIETAIVGAEHFITGLHSVTGLPWYLSIPLTAVSVSLVTRLPITIYIQRVNERRAKLTPLLQAWNSRHAKAALDERVPPQELRKEVKRRWEKSLKEVSRRWGVQRWKSFMNFAVLPVWLTLMDALRRLCGAQHGFFTTLMYGTRKDVAQAARSASTTLPPTADLGGLEPASSVSSLGMEGMSELITQPTFGVEESLSTGGCFWFTDLTAADPIHVLPVALSVVMFLNVMPTSIEKWRQIFGLDSKEGSTTSSVTTESKGMNILQRALLVIAPLIGLVTLNFPAALHIYWISSATFTLVQTEVVKRLFKRDHKRIPHCRGVESNLTRPRR